MNEIQNRGEKNWEMQQCTQNSAVLKSYCLMSTSENITDTQIESIQFQHFKM